ncbi:MAG TPA: LuxR C-terminal-related transcriptional regulator, partial [Dehalococcoidia bacterium]|nr:LuxR C-terminal-related transcriptional regulator [Dehalococcoidia bacterium]
AALEWALRLQQTEIALRLVAALGWYWCRRAEIAEGRRWTERALALPQAPEHGIAYAGAVLGKQQLYEVERTRLPDLQPALEQAAHAFAEAGDLRGEARARLAICINQPRAAAQREALDHARTLFLAAGDVTGWARASIVLSGRLFVEGEVDAAGRVLDEAIAALRTQRDGLALAAALRTLTERYVVADRHELGRAAAQEALGLAQQSGDRVLVSVLLDLLTLIADQLDNDRLAAELLGESRALSRRLGLDMREADTLAMRAQSMIRRRRFAEAHALLSAALQLMLDRGEPSRMGKVLGTFAGLANRMGDARRAAVLLGAAEVVIEEAGVMVDVLDQPLHQRTIASVRRQLGEAAFSAAWANGRALSFEDAISLARLRPDDLAAQGTASPDRERRAPAVAAPAGLSPREIEVLRLIAAGRSTRELATDLGISEGTVERHVTNLYTKITAHNRAEAAAYAFRHGLVSSPHE